MAKRILLVQTAFLGDAILSLVLARHIKKMYPQATLELVCRAGLASFFKQFSDIYTQVYEIKKGNSQSYKELLVQLGKFDIVICPHRSVRSAFFVRSIQADLKIGFKSLASILCFDKSLAYPKQYPDPIRQLSLLTLLDKKLAAELTQFEKYDVEDQAIQVLKPIPADYDLHFFDSEKSQSRSIVFFPGSVWNTKRWTEAGFVELGKKLSAQSYEIAVLGSPDEKQLCDSIAAQIPGAISYAGQLSLWQSVQQIRKAKLLVSNDSGGQHLAALTDVPIVSIFGPTVLSLGFRPWSSQSVVVQNEKLKCRPCGKHGHKVCPIGTHECMTSISAQQVYQAVQKLI